MYAKDLSKKIRTALHTMQSEGKWVGGCPPFGYKVDSEDKNHLVVDEVEGPIIKRIFDLFVNGHKINQIRDILNDEKVPTFSVARNRSFEREGKSGNIYGYWSNTTLKKILKNNLLHFSKNKKYLKVFSTLDIFLAEAEGFEPSRPLRTLTV